MSNYIKEEEKSSPRASVIRQKEFSYLPPTLIIVAELDPLRDGCYGMWYEKTSLKNYIYELLNLIYTKMVQIIKFLTALITRN